MALPHTQSHSYFPLVIFIIAVMCVCVVMQMLGVSTTMWSPSATPDTLSAALFEGLAIPPAIPRAICSVLVVPLETIQQSLHTPLLTRSLFHPPVSR